MNTTVLVTGGTGFIAQHCILALLGAGYRVRTTVRALSREAEVRQQLKVGGAEPGERLSFVAADLNADPGWAEAAEGCTHVLHGASPTPTGDQASEDDWIRPAVDGNLRVLRAAQHAGVRRVVLTSAFGAICAGHGEMGRPFADYSHSIRLIKRMLEGQPGCPKINSGFVDVRDVADLHLRAMTNPAARGERFLAIAGDSLWLSEVAKVLQQRMGGSARNVKAWALPNWVVRLGALKDPALRGSIPLLGRNMNATSEKAKRMLGWAPRSREDAIVATAESLIRLGLVASS